MLIKQNAILRRKAGIAESEIDDQLVMMDLAQSKFFGLNGVGKSIWGCLQEPTTVDSICRVLLSEYDVNRVDCENDVKDFILALQKANLVEISE